jgi:hypothetical protein
MVLWLVVIQARTAALVALLAVCGCVPSGSVGAQDAGAVMQPAVARPTTSSFPVAEMLRAPFEDDFERTGPSLSSSDGSASAWVDPGADWYATAPGVWRIDGGRLCGERAHNHGIWLKRTLPTNARIEFDAMSTSADGDLKAEYWGDGRSSATGISYTNATSYLTIFGGWHNKFHVLARLDEHAADRKEIPVDPTSDDPRERPVVAGQRYHFKVERTDAHLVRWWIDGVEMLTYPDQAPLVGVGHDHFGFNDWEVRVCFDSVRVVPLP